MKHRKPSRIKASTSLTLVGAAAVVTLLGSPANAAPADPGVVPTAPDKQPDATTDNPAPENPQNGAGTGGKPEVVKPDTKPSQPGVTTPGTPKPDTTQPNGGQPAGDAPKTDPGAAQPAGDQPKPADPGAAQPAVQKPTQPGVTVPRVAPLPVPGQSVPAVTAPDAGQPAVQTKPEQNAPGAQVNPGTTKPETTDNSTQDPALNTLTSEPTVQQPRWQAPVVETAPAAPVVEMTGPHTEVGANIDGGGLLPGWAANTHHFSNLDGYVGTIGYTTPGGLGEAGVSLDFTTLNQIKVTAFATANAGDDRKMEFYLDTTAANAAKTDAENFVRLLPGGTVILDAAAQIGKLPQGEIPGQTVDLGGLTTQVGGSVQY
ncbi:hypothetical protein AB0N05_22950 [Nocardia sp. NPDC051030]|uniref:hypothetical protein n=1 Tax=Nocardia sp. NPDC051030 TaxID=3155162 RepID=UPI00343B86B7